MGTRPYLGGSPLHYIRIRGHAREEGLRHERVEHEQRKTTQNLYPHQRRPERFNLHRGLAQSYLQNHGKNNCAVSCNHDASRHSTAQGKKNHKHPSLHPISNIPLGRKPYLQHDKFYCRSFCGVKEGIFCHLDKRIRN